jgi:hypothetical protein
MSVFFAKRPARGGRSMVRLRPIIEGLEGRVVLSTFRLNTGPDMVAANLKAGQDSSAVACVSDQGDDGPEEPIMFVYGELEVSYSR